MRPVVLALLFVMMVILVRIPEEFAAGLASRATLSLGFIMLAAFFSGRSIRRAGFPLITGYILAGLLCGPHVLGLLSEQVIVELRLIDSIALSLIALAAGGELRWKELRAGLRGILLITGFQSLFVFGGIFLLLLFLFGSLPSLRGMPSSIAVPVALFLSVIAAANSPSTVIAVVTELRARGRMTESILGVTVLKDVLVIALFAGVASLSIYLDTAGGSLDLGLIGETVWRLAASAAGGAVLGLLLIFYIDRVGAELVLFMIGVSFISTELFHHFGLHPLLATVVAGFVVQNFSSHGRMFIESLERASLPIFVIFFAIAGAGLDLSALRSWWPIVLLVLVGRTVLVWGGTALGGIAAGETSHIRRLSWLGYLPQAGVSLGLAVLVTEHYPTWGELVEDVGISMIALNQIIGPVGLKYALVRSGEAHAGSGEEDEEAGPVTPFHVMMRDHRM